LAEESSVKECPHNVGRIRWSGKGAFHRVDEVECIEVADECQNRNYAYGGQYERKFNAPENLTFGASVDDRRLDELVGNTNERSIEEDHWNAYELPHRDERRRWQGIFRKAKPRLKKTAEPYSPHHRLGDAPEGVQDQLPDEPDDDHREHCRHEEHGAIESSALAFRDEQGSEQKSNRVLHQHMDEKKDHVVFQRSPEPRRRVRVREESYEVCKT